MNNVHAAQRRRDAMRHHKRLTPEQIASIQAAEAAGTKPTSVVAPGGATLASTPAAVRSSTAAVAPSSSHAVVAPAPSSSAKVPVASSAAPVAASPSAVRSAAVGVPQAHSATTSSSAVAPIRSSAAPTSQAATSVKVVTRSSSRTSSSSAASSTASKAASSGDSSSSGLSNGGIAGIVIALLAGFLIIGCLAGYYFKKRREAKEIAAPWAKMDDDVTPFPRGEKYQHDDEDFYGGAAAPVIGSNRALAQARQNAFYADGTPRPDSAMVNGNMAGYGAGAFSPYPQAPPSAAHSNSGHSAPHMDYDANRVPVQQPYHQQQYQQNPFDDGYGQDPAHHSPTGSSGPRQLVGPGQPYGSIPVPAPVPLGRPEAPNSYDDIAAAEMYADDRYADDHLAAPRGLANYAEGEHYSPRTAADEGEWAGAAGRDSNISHVTPLPEPAPLPTLRPMSPLMALSDNSHATHTTHAVPDVYDDDEETRRMYQEVAQAAGLSSDGHEVAPAPVSPAGAAGRLPAPTHLAPNSAPYQHGLPLSPLREVPTPASSSRPLPSPPVYGQHHQPSEDPYGGI